jgi:hypothetical protein
VKAIWAIGALRAQGELLEAHSILAKDFGETSGATRRWTTKPDLDASCAPAIR